MVLESCMILLDNSEYMRNGDYVPTRLEAQHDAANLLVGAKTQSNPESTVGVIAMTGEIDGGGAELLISPTDDMGKILSSLHGIPIRSGNSGGGGSAGGGGAGGKKRSASGEARATSPTSVVPPDGSDITGAIQVASLALKHRRNKNGAQRVVVFVGSPLTCDARALTKCGRQLKKNNVAIDVIALGELEQNEPLLRELVDAANGTTSASSSSGAGGGEGAAAPAPPAETTCHLVTIPAGVLPSDVLVTSPIIHPGGAPAAAAVGAGGGGAGGDGGDAGGFAEYGGVDPNMDPELAMALRVSMEEERARQERAAAAAAAAAEGGAGDEGKAGEGGDASTAAASGGGDAAKTADGTEAAAASEGGDGGATAMAVDGKAEASSAPSDEDALLQQALAMSMGEDGVASANAAAAAAAAQGGGGGAVGMETDDDDAAMQLALQMSMQTEGAVEAPQKKEEGEEKEVSAPAAAGAGAGAGAGTSASGAAGQFQDQQFVNQLLGSLPGVDPNDPAIQDALRNLQQQQGQGGKKEGEEEGGTGDKKKDDK